MHDYFVPGDPNINICQVLWLGSRDDLLLVIKIWKTIIVYFQVVCRLFCLFVLKLSENVALAIVFLVNRCTLVCRLRFLSLFPRLFELCVMTFDFCLVGTGVDAEEENELFPC